MRFSYAVALVMSTLLGLNAGLLPGCAVPQQGALPPKAKKQAVDRDYKVKRLLGQYDNNFNPDQVEFLSQYCQELAGGGRQAEAREIMQRVLKSKNVSAHAYCSMACTYFNEVEDDNELDAARKYLALALKLDPNFSQAYYRLALVEQRYNHNAEALRLVDKALSLKDPFIPAWSAKAALLSALGRTKEAYQAACQAEKLMPDDYQALCTKAGVLQQMGKNYDAALVYKHVYSNLYKSDYLMHLIVNCLEKSGHYDEALVEMKTLMHMASGDSENYRLRASIYSKMKRYDEAVKDMSQAISMEPSATFYKERAKIFELMGKPDKARADLQSAAKLLE